MRLLRIIFLVGAAVLGGVIYWALGADARGLGPVLAEMFSEPWSVVTLIDLYLGFAVIAAVIFFFEKNWLLRAFWILPLFFLGNVWSAVWFVIRLPEMARRLRG